MLPPHSPNAGAAFLRFPRRILTPLSRLLLSPGISFPAVPDPEDGSILSQAFLPETRFASPDLEVPSQAP